MNRNPSDTYSDSQHADALRTDLEQEVYQLKVLGQIKQAVLVDQSPRRFAETAFTYLKNVIPYDHASVILFDFQKGNGEVLAVMGSAPIGINPGDNFPLEDCLDSLDYLNAPIQLTSELLKPKPSCLMENYLQTVGIRYYISHLLISHNEIIGTLNIAAYRNEPFDETSIRIARDVADSLAVAIQKAILFEQTRLKASELETLAKLSSALRRAETRDAIITIVRYETERALKADASAFIWREGDTYYIVSGAPDKPTLTPWKRSNFPDLAMWQLLDKDQPVFASSALLALRGILPILPDPPAAVLLPLKTGDLLVGKLFIGFQTPREFTVEDERLLTSIADIAGNALYRANVLETLEERVSSHTRHLETLYNISKTINQTSNLSELLDRSLAFLQQASGASVSVHLFDETRKTLVLEAARDLPEAYHAEVQHMVESVAHSGSLIQQQLPRPRSDGSSSNSQVVSYIGLPLINGRQQGLGVLSLLSTNKDAWAEDDLSLLYGVADHISIAIENAQLRNRAEAAILIEERQRLARELHDSISQLLYSQLLFAQASNRAYETNELELLPLYLNRLSEVAEQAFKEMRLMIYSLRPQVLESVGLIGALQHRLTTVEARTGLDVQLDVSQDLKLPAAVEDSLFRIAQEALNNTLKHASATVVSVRLHTENKHVMLEVTDNGKGFDRAHIVEGIGLSSMQERACQMGGTLTIFSGPGLGTTVLTVIPV